MRAYILISTALMAAGVGFAASTIDPANKYAYGANIGWVNAAGDVTDGAMIGQAFCWGYMWGANVGWIYMGDGSPADGMAYANSSATDFGVNHDGLGNLSGYAYGANIGWITFEQTYGQPRFDRETGNFSGYAWGANVGWISLSNAFAHVRTQAIDPGPDSDGDGIPDAWEYGHTNVLTVLDDEGADSDGDGAPDVDEYGADTDPFDTNDFLRITGLVAYSATNEVTWLAKPTRRYTLEYVDALSTAITWTATGPGFVPPSGPDTTETVPGVTDSNRFYHVLAEPPLSP